MHACVEIVTGNMVLSHNQDARRAVLEIRRRHVVVTGQMLYTSKLHHVKTLTLTFFVVGRIYI